MEKSKKIRSIVAGCLAAVTLATAGLAVATDGFKSFKKNDNIQMELPEENNGETVIGESTGNGVKVMSAKIAKEDYVANGISPLAETAYTLTATVLPADTTNKKVDWSIAFKNASSTWASGKTVTDYVTVTPSADGALTAVVENVAAFGEQIVVKATSRDNAEAYATCTVEYLQRTTGYTFNLDGKALSENGAENLVQLDFMESKSAAVQISVNKSTVYTRANTDKAEYFKIKPALAFGGVITASGAKSEDLKEYSGGASATLTGFFDKTWGEALHKANNTIKNKLITNISTYTGADAYTVEIYDAEGGKLLETYGLRLDTSKIVTQKGVESIEIDETEIVF